MTDLMRPLEEEVAAGLRDKHPFSDRAAAAKLLAEYSWYSIHEVITGAAGGMGFFKELAAMMAKFNETVSWFTPVGFPVDNAYYKTEAKRLRLYLYDKDVESKLQRTSVQLSRDVWKKVDVRKCQSAISPNIIHSLDSSHLLSTVLLGLQNDIRDWCLIHDSFGTLPSDTDKLFHVVRQAFVEQYKDNCVYRDIRKQLVDVLARQGHDVTKLVLPTIPEKGTLDINLVMESDYCFA